MASQHDFQVLGGLIAPGDSVINTISSSYINVITIDANTANVNYFNANNGTFITVTANTANINVLTANNGTFRVLGANTVTANTATIVTVGSNTATVNTATVNTRLNVAGQSNLSTVTVSNTITVTNESTIPLAPGNILRAYRERVTANTTATGTFNLDLNTNAVFDITLTGNTALTVSNIANNQFATSFTLVVDRTAANRVITSWPANTVWSEGIAPTQSTGAGQIDVFTFTVMRGGSLILGAHSYANVS